jgi:hypothetical protein
MAISATVTHRLLNAWQIHMGVNPWHFNQITGQGTGVVSNPGEYIFVQPEREQIAIGINTAFALIVDQLRFFHRPLYSTERFRIDETGIVRTSKKYLQALGKRTVDVLEADAAVTYSAQNGTVDDTATIFISLSEAISDLTEVQVFFRVADGAFVQADERYEIEPLLIKASPDGLTLTITGHRSLFVKPSLWEQPYRSPNYNRSSKNNGDTMSPSDFVTQVDVCRVYPGAEYTRARILNHQFGLIDVGYHAAYLNSDCWTREDEVEITYLSGYPLNPVTQRPNSILESAFIRLSNAEMPIQPTNVDDPIRNIWTNDWTPIPQGLLTAKIADNPFGIRQGQAEAWRLIRAFRW